MLDQIKMAAESYVLPLEIPNLGRRTVRDLACTVLYRGADGVQMAREVRVDYLGGYLTQTIYLYFSEDPRSLDVRARPLHYQIE